MRNPINISFFHDSRFKRDENGNFYTAGSLTAGLLTDRYVKDFGTLTVTARVEDIPNSQSGQFVSSNGKGIRFACLKGLNIKSLLFGNDRRIIRESVAQSDLVIIRMPSIIGIFAYREAKKQRKSFMVEMVACPFDSLWNYGKFIHKIAAVLLYIVNRHIVSNSPYVLYVTSDFLQKRYPTKGRSIGCSDVSIQELSNEDKKKRAAHIKNTKKSDTFVIGTIANVDVVYKGHEYIIRAIPGLKQAGYSIRYEMVGGGKGSRLEKLARELNVSNNVKFVGVLDRKDVLRWLDTVDIYAQLSLQEGLPRAMIEAMSRGCVTIGARTGGIPELLQGDDVIPRKDFMLFQNRVKEYLQSFREMAASSERNIRVAELYQDSVLSNARKDFMQEAARG